MNVFLINIFINVSLYSKEINFHAWWGSVVINNFISQAGQNLKKNDIDLRHTKITDIAETVKILLSDKKNNNFKNGKIDLIWVNGENFQRLKKNQLLFGPVDQVNNYMYINRKDASLHFDFGEPVEGLEVPWGRAQFVLIYDSQMIDKPPQTISQLVHFIKNNPGRFTYPQIPNFHGTTFLKQLLYEMVEDNSILQKPFSSCLSPCKPIENLMLFLKDIHPFLWNKGKRFPNSISETIPMLSNREIWLTINFNPNAAATNVKNGNLRDVTRTTSFINGAIGNTHYLAIPFNSSKKTVSLEVINYFISPQSQADKANIEIWGDPTVLDLNKMSAEQQNMFLGKQSIHVLPSNKFPYLLEPHHSWTEAIENEWLKTFN